MSGEEFARWRGYLRRHPAGWRWLGVQFAEVKREIAKARIVKGKVPDIEFFMGKTPEPLFYTRRKREAEAKKK